MGELQGENRGQRQGRETRGRREVWLDRRKGWRSTEPDHKRSGVQRDGNRDRETDGTKTRVLGKGREIKKRRLGRCQGNP